MKSLIPRKTRIQIIKEEREKIIFRLFSEGFLLSEIGRMFKINESRVSQIIKVETNKK